MHYQVISADCHLDLPAATQRKIVCENAAKLYGFPLT
jgi:hypothetical protein